MKLYNSTVGLNALLKTALFRRPFGEKGFTLVEIQVSIIIVAVAVLGLGFVFANNLRQLEYMESRAEAALFVSANISKLVAATYTAPAFPSGYLTSSSEIVDPDQIVNSVSLSQALVVTPSSITAHVLVTPAG